MVWPSTQVPARPAPPRPSHLGRRRGIDVGRFQLRAAQTETLELVAPTGGYGW